jgi:hypothetical protein
MKTYQNTRANIRVFIRLCPTAVALLLVILFFNTSSVHAQSPVRSGDWLVKSTLSQGYQLQLYIFPNVSGKGAFYVSKPLKILVKPKIANINSSCPAGFRSEGNYCYRCPSGYTRTIWNIKGSTACEKNWFTSSSATLKPREVCGSVRNSYRDVNGTCYECPSGYTIMALESSYSYNKCQKEYSSITAYDSLYTASLLDSLFEAKQLTCLRSGKECYVAHMRTAGDFRYGTHCGANFSTGDPRIDLVDKACRAHDLEKWADNRIDGEYNKRCASELGLKRTLQKIIDTKTSEISPEALAAAQAMVAELWFVTDVSCPPDRFPENESFNFFQDYAY